MFKKIALAAVLATLAASSFAATPGVYAGVDVGSTKLDGESREGSYGAFVGYNFHQNFAVEAGYRRLGTWEVSGVDAHVDQAAVSLIGKVPVNEQLHVYGRLGYNRLDVSAKVAGVTISDNTSKVLYGVGAGYDFGGNISARVEFQKPSSDSSNLSVGVIYSF
jgi:OOP family OmpA-OmpF porin